MELISRPETRAVELRDVDVRFIDGQEVGITLYPEDRIEETEREIRITYAENPRRGRRAEEMIIYRSHILWISRRVRVVTEVVNDKR